MFEKRSLKVENRSLKVKNIVAVGESKKIALALDKKEILYHANVSGSWGLKFKIRTLVPEPTV